MKIEEEIKKALDSEGVKPQKNLGQNFLVDEEDLSAIAKEIEIKKGETVLEVGPGIGNLTAKILARGAKIIAVEKDDVLSKILERKMGEELKIITENILDFKSVGLPEKWKLVGNIPYYLTGALLKKFLSENKKPNIIVLTVQKEVGERITKKPPRASFLSVMVQIYGEAKIVRKIPAKNFWPKPKVDSVVVKIRVNENEKPKEELVSFVKKCFSSPRKTLLNNLSSFSSVDKQELKIKLEKLGLNEKSRPSELFLDDWKNLYSIINH